MADQLTGLSGPIWHKKLVSDRLDLYKSQWDSATNYLNQTNFQPTSHQRKQENGNRRPQICNM